MSDWGDYDGALMTGRGRELMGVYTYADVIGDCTVMTELPEFKNYLEAQGLSDGTVGTYVRVMRGLTRRKSMLAALRDDKAMATKTLYLAALRHWARFKEDQELLEQVNSPAVRRRVKAAGSRLPKEVEPLEDDEMDLFLAGLEAVRRLEGAPVWVWPALSMMTTLGLRVGVDLCNIQRAEAVRALRTGELRLWTKGGKTRGVPAGIVTEELEALVSVPAWEILSDLIAPGTKDPGSASYAAVTRTMKSVAEASGLDPDAVHAHRFRHSAAMRLYEISGHDLHLVQQLLGHSQIDTTAKYLKINRIKELDAQLTRLKYGKKETGESS